MLMVTVEVWPGGRYWERQVIGTMSLTNVSNLNDISCYEGYVDDVPITVKNHRRSDGAWKLIHTALS